MMRLAPGTRVYLSCQPVDMRKGFNGLTALVSTLLNADPYCGHLFVFRGKRGDYMKVLHWDGSGLCLFAKRLEDGKFAWPSTVNECLTLSPAQFALLTEGIDWRRTRAVEMSRPQPIHV